MQAASDLLLVLALVGLCVAVGRTAVERLPGTALSPRELLLFSLGVGVGVVGTSILLLGLAGFLNGGGLAVLCLACVGVCWKSFVRLPSLLGEALADVWAGWSLAEFAFFGILAIFMLSHAALPPTNFDSLAYHLAVPELYLREGRIFLPPNNFHAAFVGLVHMLYIPLLAVGGAAAPAMLSSVLALSLIPLAQLLGEYLADGQTGRIASILVWGGPILVLGAITPRIDVTLVWYLLLGHYAVLLVVRDPTRRRLLWIGGALLGCAIGVKLSAVLYIVGVSPLILFVGWRQQRSGGRDTAGLAIFVVAVIVSALPWLIRNWMWLGDPLYPHLAGSRVEAWLQALYGGELLPSGTGRSPSQQLRILRIPFNFFDFFFAPRRLTPEAEALLYFANPALWVLPLWLLFRRGTDKLWLALPAVAYGLAVVIRYSGGLNLRYLIPAVVPLAIVSAALVVACLRRHLHWAATVLLMLPFAASVIIWTATQPAWRYLTGRLSASEYLSDKANGDLRSYLNENTPVGSQILMLFDARGFGISRSVIPDYGVNWLRLAPAASERCLEATDITYVVVNKELRGYLELKGLDLSTVRWQEFSSFADRCLHLIKDENKYEVYRVFHGQSAAIPDG